MEQTFYHFLLQSPMSARSKWALYRRGTWKLDVLRGFPKSRDYLLGKTEFSWLHDATLNCNDGDLFLFLMLSLQIRSACEEKLGTLASPSSVAARAQIHLLRARSRKVWSCSAVPASMDYFAKFWGKCKEARLRQSWSNLISQVLSVVKHTFWSPSAWLLLLPFNCFQTQMGRRRYDLLLRNPNVNTFQEVVRWEAPWFKWDSVMSVSPLQSKRPLPSEIQSPHILSIHLTRIINQ